jgi:glycerol-3-phosphate dehydrogenase
MLLLGTTDEPFEGDPADVLPQPQDATRILREAAHALDSRTVDRARVLAAFAGLRVLPEGPSDVASARRETVFTRGPACLLSVAGGKLTTYRRIALEVIERLRPELGVHRVDRRPWPLPGASGLESVAVPPELDPEVREHLLHLYGSLVPEVLAPARDDPRLLERISPNGPDIAAQVPYAATREWARSADDVLRRRTTLFYRGLADGDAAARVSMLLRDNVGP